jgi:predicted HicB family RNase H-like nuclease
MSTIELLGYFALGPYKGYYGRAEYDAEELEFHGKVVDTRDVITFVGSDLASLEKEFQKSIDVYLDFCASRGEDPEKPYSGNYALRMPASLHRELAIAAFRTNKSFNQYLIDVLSGASLFASTAKAEPIADRSENTFANICFTARATTSQAKHPKPVLLPITG